MTAAFAASDLLRGAIAFATSLVIARGLGRTAFGEWTLYMAWAATLTVLFDLGFGVLLTRNSARRIPVGPLLATSLTARLGLFVPAAVAIAAAALWRGGIWMAGSTDVLLILAIAAAGIAYGCHAAAYRATPRTLVGVLALETAGAAVQCGAAAVVVLSGGGIRALLVIAAAVQIVQLAAVVVAWPLVAPADPLVPPSWSDVSRFGRLAFPFALTGIVANTQARIGPILLGIAATPADVAAFGVALRLQSIARRLPAAAFGAALPVFSDEIANGTSTRLRSEFDGVMRAFALVAATTLVAGAGPIVWYSYGPPFAGARVPLMWAGVALVPGLVNAARRVFLYAAGRERIVVRVSAATWVAQAIACAALIPRFGASGAMCAFALAEAAAWWPFRQAAAAADRGEPRRHTVR